MTDKQYGVEYNVDLWRCIDADCLHVFVFPEPEQSDVSGFYDTYSTHQRTRPRKIFALYDQFVAILLAFDSMGAQKRSLKTMGLESMPPGRVLDVGCGAGALLLQLRELGWNDLYGIDFDPMAVKAAEAAGLSNVHEGTLASKATYLPKFDYIIFNHVVEHLSHPGDNLAVAALLLEPQGRILLRTPNASSFLSHLFGAAWRGWEAPRHLNVFTKSSIRSLAERAGFEIESLETSNAMLTNIFLESVLALAQPRSRWARRTLLVGAVLVFPFFALVAAARRRTQDMGEEIVASLQLGRRSTG